MQNPDGRFRNFMDYQRHFLDEAGSDDSFGRALWALGYIIWRPPRDAYRSLAFECFQKALPHVRGLNLRGKSLAMLGLAAYLRCYQGDESVTALLRECADYLLALYKDVAGDDWRWFEDIICYDNGIMPMALFQTYALLREDKYLQVARETLEFLEKNLIHDGRLSIIGSNGWYKRGGAQGAVRPAAHRRDGDGPGLPVGVLGHPGQGIFKKDAPGLRLVPRRERHGHVAVRSRDQGLRRRPAAARGSA